MDRVPAITGQSVNAAGHKKMGSDVLCDTEELVDIAFPIANVNTSLWFIQQSR